MSTNIEIRLKKWCQFNKFPVFDNESGIPRRVVGPKYRLSYRWDNSLKKMCIGQDIFSKMMVMHHIWYKNEDHLMNLLFLTLHEEFLLKLALKSLFPQGRQPIEKNQQWILTIFTAIQILCCMVWWRLSCFFSTKLDFWICK